METLTARDEASERIKLLAAVLPLLPEEYLSVVTDLVFYIDEAIREARVDAQKRENLLRVTIDTVLAACNRERAKLPCRMDEMSAREFDIANMVCTLEGDIHFIRYALETALTKTKGETQ